MALAQSQQQHSTDVIGAEARKEIFTLPHEHWSVAMVRVAVVLVVVVAVVSTSVFVCVEQLLCPTRSFHGKTEMPSST